MKKIFFLLLFVASFQTLLLAFSEGIIVFTSARDGNWEIYTMNAHGSNQTRITDNPSNDWNPEWSPDGSKIIFSSDRNGNNDIFIMNADGSDIQCLTENTICDEFYPSWSPDGKRVTYTSYKDNKFSLYTMNSDGGEVRLLYDSSESNYSSKWSPDGKTIVFVSRIKGDAEICTINPDGSGFKRLTTRSGQDACPQWSADGNKIVFSSSNRGSGEDIAIMNSDGSGYKVVVRNYKSNDFAPCLSPDGNYIAYQTGFPGTNGENDEIVILDIKTGKITRLTDSPGWDSQPDWKIPTISE